MDSIPKFMASVITIIVGVVVCISFIITTITVNSARTYHSSVIDQIEASDFDAATIEKCIKNANNSRYGLKIEKTSTPEAVSTSLYKVTLTYNLYAPIFGKVHVGKLVGYALAGSHIMRGEASGEDDHYFEIDENGVLGIKATYRWATGREDYASDNGKDAAGSKNALLPSEIVIPEYFKGVKVVALRDYMFAQCEGLTSLSFENGVKTIGAYAFQNCNNLTGEITLPDSVKEIKNNAFDGCSGVTKFNLGNSVETIGEAAFKDCIGISDITFPDTVESVGLNALQNCNNLTSFTAPFAGGDATTKHVSQLGYLFGATQYSDNASYVPASLKNIHLTKYASKYALYECANITNLTIGDAITKIDEYFCCDCDGLTTVVIPAGVVSTNSSSFYSCDNLTTVTFESDNTFTTIGAASFAYCKALSEIKIPTTVTQIGNYAFQDCDKLTFGTQNDGKLPEGVLSLGIGAFKECDGFSTFVIPSSVTSVKNQIFTKCKNLTNIQVASGNTAYCVGAAGELLTIDRKQIVQYPYAGPTSYTLPSTITVVGDDAFAETNRLTYLDLTSATNLTEIGYGAFKRCSKIANDIRIPNTVTSIGKEAFMYCGTFKNIYISSGISKIENYAFYDVGSSTSALNIYILSDNLTKVGTESVWTQMATNYTYTIYVKNDAVKNVFVQGSHYSEDGVIVVDSTIH